MLGYDNQPLAAFVGLAPLLPAAFLKLSKKLWYGETVFICVAVSGLATAGYRDYHLMIFLAPLLIAESRLVAVASLLMLAPKGFVTWGDLSAQILLNPLIAMAAILALLLRAHARNVSDQSRASPTLALFLGRTAPDS